jgi:hypothetical protein
LRGKKIPYEENHRELNGLLEKKCNICDKWYPCTSEYFYPNKGNKTDGLCPECKTCTVKRSMKRNQEYREEYLADKRRINHKPENKRKDAIKNKLRRERGGEKIRNGDKIIQKN